jgi:hypothetical protein
LESKLNRSVNYRNLNLRTNTKKLTTKENMKKTLILAMSIATLSLNSFAQGYFAMIWYDGVHGLSITGPSSPANHAGLLLGSEYSVEAYLGAAGAGESSLQPLAASKIAFDLNGATRAGATAADGSGQFYALSTINTGLPTGGAAIQIRAWFNNGQFATYEAALAAGMNNGKSPVMPITLKAATDPTVQDLTAIGMQPFAVSAVPEPSTIALAGLGAASLLVFRRRK